MTLFQILLPTVHWQQKDDKSINSRIFIDKPLKKPWLTPNFSYRIFDQKASLEIPSIRINYWRSVTGYVATNCPAEIAIFSLSIGSSRKQKKKEKLYFTRCSTIQTSFSSGGGAVALHCRHHQHLYQKAKKKIVRKGRLFRPIPTFI